MIVGLAGTVIVGGLIPYTGLPILTFALFGIFFVVATPIIASLPMIGGVLRDTTGTAMERGTCLCIEGGARLGQGGES